ncbi:MAG TPA: pyridoxal-phosphate dependent enzyme [Candidatus Paceibacterota bacterium]|nr:pyridoxal-phosphate dependent enzyme [Candidatus Paceibacterota bacterium]
MDSALALPRIISVNSDVLPVHWAKFFVENRAKLHIVVLYENEAENGKMWPAQEIVFRGVSRGDHGGADTIIDSTSGNYGTALAAVIRQHTKRDPGFPIKRVVSVVSRSLPQGKRDRLLACGIELIDADDAIDAMRVAEAVAKERGYWYTKQYWNKDNSAGYRRVAEHIANQLPTLGLIAWGVGSGGGCSGIMPVLQERFKNRGTGFHRVAVVAEDGQKIGGVRDEKALEPGSLDWRTNVDDVRFIAEDPSYRFSAALWRGRDMSSDSAYLVGPSTGFAAEGACLAARRLSIMRTFDEVRAPDGFVHILVPALDKRTPYRLEYEQKGVYLPKSEWE